MAEAIGRMGELQRDALVGNVDELIGTDYVSVGRVDGGMQHLLHQVLANDVAVDQRDGSTRAQKIAARGLGLGAGVGVRVDLRQQICDDAIVQ